MWASRKADIPIVPTIEKDQERSELALRSGFSTLTGREFGLCDSAARTSSSATPSPVSRSHAAYESMICQ
jgi:hypothetical protein